MQFQIVIIATLQSVSQEMLSSSILTVLDDVKQGVCHDNTLNETWCFIQNYKPLKNISYLDSAIYRHEGLESFMPN